MDVKKAREILGKESNKYDDGQILEFINTAKLLSNIAIEEIQKIIKEESKWLLKKK